MDQGNQSNFLNINIMLMGINFDFKHFYYKLIITYLKQILINNLNKYTSSKQNCIQNNHQGINFKYIFHLLACNFSRKSSKLHYY